MKKFLFLMFAVIAIVSCEDREPDPIIVPEWIKPRIAELEAEGGDCPGCEINRYTYDDVFFYQVICSHWSCIDCEVYYYDGTLIDWETALIDRADFEQNKTRPTIIWQCGDEL